MSVRGISDLERGISKRPQRETLASLLDALQLNPRDRTRMEALAGKRSGSAPELHPSPSLAISPPSLVGRARELDLIEHHMTGESTRVLVFAGEPGIGKSCLLQEGARLARAAGYTVLQGGGQRWNGQDPYTPILEVLARSLDALTPARLRSALTGCSWLPRLLPELVEMASVPLPIGILGPEHERRLVFAAVARYLSNLAGAVGLMLVLDDLQWASPDGLDLLASLIGALDGENLRVLGAYRNTDVGADSPLVSHLTDMAGQHLMYQRELGPLSDAEAESLLDSILRNLEEEERVSTKQGIVARAGGVPFYLVTCAHDLESRTRTEFVPWTIAHSIQRRVAALSPQAQDILAVGALIGMEFRRAILTHLLEYSEEEVFTGLDAACRAGLLLAQDTSSYRFVHDIFREAIEANLGNAQRVLLHKKIAKVLEGLPQHEWGRDGTLRAAELAWHFTQGDEPQKALSYRIEAGDGATVLFAHEEAERHYWMAAHLADDLDNLSTRIEVLQKLGVVLTNAGRFDEALAVLEETSTLCRSVHDSEGEGHTVAQIGRIHGRLGTTEEGIARLKPVVAHLEQPATQAGSGSSVLADLHSALSHLYFAAGRYAEQLVSAERASEMARTAGADRILSDAEMRRGLALRSLGRTEDALQVWTEVLPLMRQVGDLYNLSHALNNLASAYAVMGKQEQARTYRIQAVEVAENTGDPRQIAFMVCCAGEHSRIIGEWEKALIEAERAWEMTGPAIWFSAYPPLLLGSLSTAKGNSEEGRRWLQQSISIAERAGDLQALRLAHQALAEQELMEQQPELARTRLMPLLDRPGLEEADVTILFPTLALACLATGDTDLAAELAQRGTDRARRQADQRTLLEALRANAAILAHQQRFEEAEQTYEQAASLVRPMCFTYSEALTRYDWGKMHIQMGDLSRAGVLLSEAMLLFQQLGARPYIKRTEDALEEVASHDSHTLSTS